MIDTHVHVASPDTSRYPLSPTGIGTPWWVDGRPTIKDIADLIDGQPVRQAVIVQAVGPYGFDNRYVIEAVSHDETRFSAVAAVDLDQPDAENTIRVLAEHPSISGIRLFAMTEARRWIESSVLAPTLDLAAELGLTVVMTVPGADLVTLRPCMESSSARIVIDHCAFPEFEKGHIRADQPVLLLDGIDHVTLKVTTQSFVRSGDGKDLLQQLTSSFGAHRVVWGSDFPQSEGSYQHAIATAIESAETLSEPEREAILSTNARALFGTLAWSTCDPISKKHPDPLARIR
jgi:L-fuconolactonase